MPIRLVSFDTDDTLYDFTTLSRSAIEQVVKQVRRSVGPPAATLRIDEVVADLVNAAEAVDHAYARIPELRRTAFAQTLRRYGVQDDALVEEMDRTYVRFRFTPVRPFDGTRRILEGLAREYTLCTVSNGEQDISALGLDGLFDFTLTATDVGFQKPDPRIFKAALERAGCSAGEMVHVGDSLQSDVAGAKAAGTWTVWFNPTGRSNPSDIAPNREIRSLAELPHVLKSLR